MYRPMLKLGSQGDLVKRLQFGLAALTHHPGPADGVFGPDTERAVVVLQYAAKVLTDGIAGPVTLRAYNEAIEKAVLRCGRIDLYDYRIPIHQEPKEVERPPGKRLSFRKLIIDHPPRGYPGKKHYFVRADVYDEMTGLYKAVKELGGVMTSDKGGSKRDLRVRASQYRSRVSFHYLGRAFDLHPYSGMQNPDNDAFVVTKDEDRRWTVWARSSKRIPAVKLNALVATYEYNRRGKSYTQLFERETEGAFFNFTELAARFGFHPVSVRRSFLMGNALVSADWWHFQFSRRLVWGQTRYGEELLRSYPIQRLRKDFRYWEEVKHLRYGLEWL